MHRGGCQPKGQGPARRKIRAMATNPRNARYRSSRTQEAAVSDVLGSILLVGITVVMASAFGAILLSYDGPSDVQHTQLAVTIGPGANGLWGTNEAELRILHLGGEALREGQTTVTYTPVGGVATSPTIDFGADNQLTIGEAWTQSLTAQPADAVPVHIVVDLGQSKALLASTTVSAGSAAASLVYLVSATPVGGAGTVTNLANAQSATDSNAFMGIAEGAVGGTPSTAVHNPSSATTTGGSNADGVLASNENWALLDSSGDFVQGSTFSAPGAFAVSAISIGMEARGVPAVSTVAHVATVTGTASNAASVSTVSILGSAGDVYLAAVANGVATPRTVASISGPPGITWSLVGQAANSVGNGRLEVWVGTGTPGLAGIVTATFSGGNADRAALAVSRYSGVDTSSPIQASLTGEAAGAGSTAVSLGPVTGTATNGRFYTAINGATTGTFTFTTPATERVDLDPGNARVQLGVADGVAAASNTVAATITARADWHGVALALRPLATPMPTVQLTYRLSGVTGATSLPPQLLTASDATYEVSVLADRAWTVADLANVDVRVTYPTDSGSDVEVDHVYLRLTTTTTPTTYNTQVNLGFTGVPAGDTHIVQLRYKTAGDTFRAYAMTGLVERQCPGTLSSATFVLFTCTLTVAEYNSGAPTVRIKDVTPAGTAQGTIDFEYARVSTT